MMKDAGWTRSLALPLALTFIFIGSSVRADEAPPPASATVGENAGSAPTAPTEPKTEAPVAALDGEIQEVAPGPLLEQRKSLLSKIMSAKKAGIGVGGYLSAFTFMESMVRGGKPASAIQSRLESIVQGLDDQMKRAQVLKTQHPIPPTASQSAPSVALPAAGGGAASSGNTSALINQLKQKYGDKIPADLANQSPDKLLNSDQGKELLKKFLNK